MLRLWFTSYLICCVRDLDLDCDFTRFAIFKPNNQARMPFPFCA
uniref:Uncharacterized protein n=1 Tax=Arundo donax TaxID=35708 RepID=A0A0A9EC41_ARUDO